MKQNFKKMPRSKFNPKKIWFYAIGMNINYHKNVRNQGKILKEMPNFKPNPKENIVLWN